MGVVDAEGVEELGALDGVTSHVVPEPRVVFAPLPVAQFHVVRPRYHLSQKVRAGLWACGQAMLEADVGKENKK
jgi:hypothetical protein